MFGESVKHEAGIKKAYIENTRSKRIGLKRRMELRKRGASFAALTPHMDRKVNKCYPRGKAWLRIVDLHTVEWSHGNGQTNQGGEE